MTDSKNQRQIPFVDLRAQFDSIEEEVIPAILATVKKGDYIMGENVALFESEFADFCDTKYAVGVDSGTSALEMIVSAYGFGPGDEIITQANTFIATALGITYNGAVPVLVDIDPDTFMIDPAAVEAAITPNTKAIMPVHLYGHPADMQPIMEIAERHNLVVIEDASQAHGSRYKGQRVGGIGHVAGFSLYPGKNLGAYGDAGIITTNDADLADKLRLLRNYGSREKYHHESIGYNRRLDTLQASVLRTKLPHLDDWSAARRRNAAAYTERLADTHLTLPQEADGVEPVYHLYVVRTDRREELKAHLEAKGIGAIIHYPIPIHQQPAYAHLGYNKGDFPITEAYSEQILSLPMFPELTVDDIDYIVDAIKEFEAVSSPELALA